MLAIARAGARPEDYPSRRAVRGETGAKDARERPELLHHHLGV
jgi:hypothetical protein